MEEIAFQEIQTHYEKKKKEIENIQVKKIYEHSNFTFLLFIFTYTNLEDTYSNNSTNKEEKTKFLFNYLQNFKFLTYYINSKRNPTRIKSSIEKVDVVICGESECLIIENIDLPIIIQIFDNLRNQKISLINSDYMSTSDDDDNQDAKKEIESFCKHFLYEIDRNAFVKLTIMPIVGYLIRRFYYPSEYFKSKSFFNFDESKKSKEREFKEKINNFFFEYKIQYENENDNIQGNQDFISKISQEVSENSNSINTDKLYEFNENDFIILRTIHENENACFSLVIHLESLYIFVIKKAHESSKITQAFQHEIDFCKKQLHEYFARFYGFLIIDSEINGFVYEFMCNGQISSYIKSLSVENHHFFAFTSLVRIFFGIYNLHLRNLVFRDLKPANILLDHDFLPYICDFETIREPAEEDNMDEMTKDIGNVFYMAPEQYLGGFISYPADIYSFGKIIYFLYEKKDPNITLSDNVPIKKMENGPKVFQELYEKCVKFEQSERPTYSDVWYIIINELKLFDHFEYYLLNKNAGIKKSLIIQIIYELTKLLFPTFTSNLTYFEMLNDSKLSLPRFYNLLGKAFSNLFGSQNISKAIHYFELASELNDIDSILKLADIYENGTYAEKDYTKVFKYYKLAAAQNNVLALCKLGSMYESGLGVKKDVDESLKYFKLAAAQNYDNTLWFLKQIYSESIKYYEILSNMNDQDAQLKMGFFYEVGLGIKKDFLKAKEYYELSASQGNSEAHLNLGNLYANGYGVEQDYLKAKEYYEISASSNNPSALYNLGVLYEYGYGVLKNYSKSMHYYELSAKEYPNAYLKIANFYEFGLGVEQNVMIAKKYYDLACQNGSWFASLYSKNSKTMDDIELKKIFEIGADQNDSTCYAFLGCLYERGLGCKRDHSKALHYYKLSAQFNSSEGINLLGSAYLNGIGTVKDYHKAIECYKSSAKYKNGDAFINLSYVYYKGLGVEQNDSKVFEFLDYAAKQNNTDAFYILGSLYLNKGNFKKSKYYFELGKKYFDSNSFYSLGKLYENGLGVKQDYKKAIHYFDLSSQLNHPGALFYLGYIYSNGYITEINKEKSIELFTKCIKSYKEKNFLDESLNLFIYEFQFNYFNYISYNNLGLLYIESNFDKAFKYIKEAAFNEYPYGQNNLGLLYQFYCDDMLKSDKIENAKYYYKKASKNNFVLAKFNRGYIFEKEGEIDKAIKYYTKASNDDDENLVFHGYKIEDRQLKISKMFIIFFTNIKLTEFYFSNSNYEKSKDYFIKAFSKLELNDENESYRFRFEYKRENLNNLFNYLKVFVLNFPLFNFANQKNLEIDPNLFKSEFKKEFQKLNRKQEQQNINYHENNNSNNALNDINIKMKLLSFENVEKIIDAHENNNSNNSLNDINKKMKLLSFENVEKIIDAHENNKEFQLYTKHSFVYNENCMFSPEFKDEMKQIHCNENEFNHEKNTFYDAGQLFDFAMQNEKIKSMLHKEIMDIIELIEKILYKPPYAILFGRINISHTSKLTNLYLKNIDEKFYEGFEFNDCL